MLAQWTVKVKKQNLCYANSVMPFDTWKFYICVLEQWEIVKCEF